MRVSRAFLGHLFPVWVGFKGGKGVATYLGILLGIAPIGVLVFAVVWLSVAFFFRYSSLAALAATLVVPVVLFRARLHGRGRPHRDPDRHRLYPPSRQYPPAAGRHGGQDRSQGVSPSDAPPRGVGLPDETRLAWLRLIRSENVGPATFRSLINRYGGAEAALAALPELAARGGRSVRVESLAAAEDEMNRGQPHGRPLHLPRRAGLPAAPQGDGSAPPVLAVMGNADGSPSPAVAMVGARNASLSGIKMTRQFADEIGRAGYVVVSGLARGIDAAAHEAALEHRHDRRVRRRPRPALSATRTGR